MSEKHYTFDGQEDPHFETELELRMWMAGKNSEIAAQRERELARLQDENRRLRAFVEWCATGNLDNNQMGLVEDKAAALLASMKPADGSELAALRRQIVVLEHDRRGLYDALIEAIGEDANRIMNNIRASTPKD